MYPARIAAGTGHAAYQRHRPEDTLLYQLVAQYYPEFEALMARQGTPLPGYVIREFEVAHARPCARDISASMHVRLPAMRSPGARLPAGAL